MSKIWFITGSSRGLGRQFAQAALSRGDKVAATARSADSLADLVAAHGDQVLPLALDVTDKAAVTAAVQRAHEHFGRLDAVVNNAGTAVSGMVEELSEDDVRAQFEANLFGSLWVTQAALPYLRAQGSGHLVMVSSMLAHMTSPTMGAYTASKAAMEGLAEALAQEVAAFSIKVTIVEPGAFATDMGASAAHAEPLAAYDGLREEVMANLTAMPQPSPRHVGQAMLKVVDAENPPLRVFFGTVPLQVIPQVYAESLKTWEEWAELSAEAEAGQS
ncbi:SDR family NAD(P)-dependent oxidoreductase [Streptomyces bobili]|uniref:SDR family NAD(P)-dependent oxidoreductase n=1 Tax=Streptomyces bobili TaxID=67280 RepID=UPI0036F4F19C